eukprot:7388538-Prymnesium_polylepis.3
MAARRHGAWPCGARAQACWDQTLSFYETSGQQYGRDRPLGFDPCCCRHFSNGEYICVSGAPSPSPSPSRSPVANTSVSPERAKRAARRNPLVARATRPSEEEEA